MNRRYKIGDASALSAYSALMLAAFLLTHRRGIETPLFGTWAYVLLAAAAMAVSGAVTVLTMTGKLADDYQISRMGRITLITGVLSKGLLPVIVIAGVAMESLGFVVCVGMLAEWALLFVNAASAVVIGRWK